MATAAQNSGEPVPEYKPGDMLKTREAAEVLGIAKSTLEQWRCAQVDIQPKYYKYGRAVRYRYSDLLDFLSRNGVG